MKILLHIKEDFYIVIGMSNQILIRSYWPAVCSIMHMKDTDSTVSLLLRQ